VPESECGCTWQKEAWRAGTGGTCTQSRVRGARGEAGRARAGCIPVSVCHALRLSGATSKDHEAQALRKRSSSSAASMHSTHRAPSRGCCVCEHRQPPLIASRKAHARSPLPLNWESDRVNWVDGDQSRHFPNDPGSRPPIRLYSRLYFGGAFLRVVFGNTVYGTDADLV